MFPGDGTRQLVFRRERYTTMLHRILCVFLFASIISMAQTTNGRIVGAVSDPSGLAVVGVEVSLLNLKTNDTRKLQTDQTGGYVFANLPIGSYEIGVFMKGFKRFVQRPIDLMVDQTVRVDVRLQVGEVAEQVTVEAGAPLLQTDQSGISQVVENKVVVELPLNGRNFVRLGTLMPGTTQGAPGETRRARQGGEVMTANGARTEHNTFLLDGVDNTSFIEGVAALIPSIDAIQEFKVETANYSAEYGRASGAIINVAIKSGTNQIHGTAYEFLRNNAMDARDFFAVGLPPLRRNQFGFSVGGPVIKDRLFLFGNAEWVRERRGFTASGLVPTEAQRRGDFSGSPTIFDPFDTDATGLRRPFPNNAIPQSRISPISQKVLPMWPLPNTSDPARPYVENLSNPLDQGQFHLRGDWRASSKDQIMVRISNSVSEQLANAIALNGQYNNFRPKGAVAGWTRTISPSLINEARFSAYLFQFELLGQGQGTDYASALGLPSYPLNDQAQKHPTISVRNFAAIGGPFTAPLFRKEINYQFVDQAMWISGRQTLKFGIDIRRYQSNQFQPQSAMGEYTFNGPFTAQRNGLYPNGLPDFLLGAPVQQRILDPSTYDAQRLRNTRLNLYVQDDINLRKDLTINLGLRWERDGDWTEANNRWAYFDYATGQLVYPKALVLPSLVLPYPHRFEEFNSMKRPTNRAFAPRAGLAWRPFGDNRTVVRMGYGLSWGQPSGFVLINTAQTPPPLLLRTDMVSSNQTPELRFGVFPGPSAVPANPSFFTHQPSSYANPYTQQWNVGIQREIAGSIAAKISYVGAKGTHLERRYEGNAALPPRAGAVNPRRLYQPFLSILQSESSASSTYHSLQVSAEQRLRAGLHFLAGYTWAKALDDGSSWSPNADSSHLVQDPRNLGAEKARSAFDLRQRFTLSAIYQLPFSFRNPLLQQAAGGWKVSGIVTLQTGFPTTPVVGGDTPNAATGTTRPNLNGPGNLPVDQRTIDLWFNTTAFSLPPAFTFGTAGRNIIDMPGTRAFDFSALKDFRIVESQSLQFRAEFFNFLNHPNFGRPGLNFGATNFGVIRAASGGREIQLGLKYIF